MLIAVRADAYAYRVTLKARRPKHRETFWNRNLSGDAFADVAPPVGPNQCSRLKSIGISWIEIFRDVREVDAYRQPQVGCDPLNAPFYVLLSKKASQVIAGDLFLDTQTTDQFGESVRNIIVAQSVKHLLLTWPLLAARGDIQLWPQNLPLRTGDCKGGRSKSVKVTLSHRVADVSATMMEGT